VAGRMLVYDEATTVKQASKCSTLWSAYETMSTINRRTGRQKYNSNTFFTG